MMLSGRSGRGPDSKGQIVELCELLRTFIDGRDRSLVFANRIESTVARWFPGDPRFEDLETALALYSPITAEGLIGEADLAAVCVATLTTLVD
jgi:hypothetical protein